MLKRAEFNFPLSVLHYLVMQHGHQFKKMHLASVRCVEGKFTFLVGTGSMSQLVGVNVTKNCEKNPLYFWINNTYTFALFV